MEGANLKISFAMPKFTSIIVILIIAVTMTLFAGCVDNKVLQGQENEAATITVAPSGTAASGGSETSTVPAAPTGSVSVTPSVPGDVNETAVPAQVQPTQPATTGSNGDVQKPVKPPVKVKALYLTGWTVGSNKNVQHYTELAKRTEINSYVIDIKDDDGYVGYKSEVPEVVNSKAYKVKYDVDSVIRQFHESGVYIIGRIVCFKDPVYSSKNPDLAIRKSDGGLWKENGKVSWLNPYKKENWDYIIKIAKEAVEKGFDEIQFDYVRFPSVGKNTRIDYGITDKEKYEAINEFLAYAKKEMPDVIISADVFGIICESPGDTENIGQYLELIGKDIDYISPMVYPSHYALGQHVNGIKFAKPDFEPYGVVYNSLIKAKNRIKALPEGEYKAGMRPYLQDFTATWLGSGNYMKYGPEQVRQQIKAVYDAGYEEWILWDAGNTYSEGALLKE